MDEVSKCPQCRKSLYEYSIIDWDDDRPVYECECGCISDNNGEDITEEYED